MRIEILRRPQCAVWLAVLIAMLFAAVAVAAQTAQKEGNDSAQKVAIDPTTHQVRPPTPEESKKLSEGTNFVRVPENVQVKRLPNGASMAELPEEYMDATVVTKNADGTLSMHCVKGMNTAEALVKSAAPQNSAKPSVSKTKSAAKSGKKTTAAAKGKE